MEGIFLYFKERPSKHFVVAGFLFLFGVGLTTGFFDTQGSGLVFLIGALLFFTASFLLHHDFSAQFFTISLTAFFFGCFLGVRALPPARVMLPNKSDTIIARIVKEPVVKEASVQYTVELVQTPEDKTIEDRQSSVDPKWFCLRCLTNKIPKRTRALITTTLYPRFHYGNTISFSCNPKIPFRPKSSYRDGVVFTCTAGHITLVSTPPHNPFTHPFQAILGALIGAKDSVRAHVSRYIREPYASFLGGFLYGERARLSSDIANDLVRTGTVHIIAVSGYNITLIVTALITVCTYIGISRRRVFPILCVFIVAFVLFVGGTASVVRAALFGVIAAFARHIGRTSSSLTLLSAAAVGMVAHQPLTLLYDVGFQLSFLATLGLVYGAPLVEQYVGWVPETFGLRASGAQTIAATLATAPLILFVFGRLSLVAVLANMSILWMVPAIMMAGFLLLAASFVLPPLAMLLGYIMEFFLRVFLVILQFYSKLPFASVDMTFPWWGMLLAYVMLMCLVFCFSRNSEG